jgi:hypothetical protein
MVTRYAAFIMCKRRGALLADENAPRGGIPVCFWHGTGDDVWPGMEKLLATNFQELQSKPC